VIYKQFTTPAPPSNNGRASAYPLSAATAFNRGARTRAVFCRNRNGSSLGGMIYFPDINHGGSRGPCIVTVLLRMGIIDETRN